LISLKDRLRLSRHGFSIIVMEPRMPAETILVVSLIVLAFTIFGATLFYADYSSRPSRR
jgi:hypothetical protein